MRTYKINSYVSATLIAKNTYNVHCSKCNEHFMVFEGKKKDIEAALKAQPVGVRKKMAKHIKSHERDSYIPKTIRKGENMKVLNLATVLKDILVDINKEPVMPEPKQKESVDVLFKFDMNYIAGTDIVGNVSGYYVPREVDAEAEMIANRIANKPRGKVCLEKEGVLDIYYGTVKDEDKEYDEDGEEIYTPDKRLKGKYKLERGEITMGKKKFRIGTPGTMESNIMLNYEFDYVSAEKEDDNEPEEGDILETLEAEYDADAMLEDIVRGKFIPRGLKGANKLIGWFMSTVKKDAVTKMYQYCRAVRVDKETMELIKFKMGAKLPSLETSDNEVGYMDEIYSPDAGGIASEEKTHKSLEYLRFERGMVKWLPKKNKIAIDIVVANKHLLSESELDYWRYMLAGNGVELSKQMKFFIMRAKRIIQIPELQQAYAEYLSTRVDRHLPGTYDHCESIYPYLYAVGRMNRIKEQVAHALLYYPENGDKKTKAKKSKDKPSTTTPSIPSPTRGAQPTDRIVVKVFPESPSCGLKEGFIIGAAFHNGAISTYVSGRSFDVNKVLCKLKEKYSSTHTITILRMDPRSVSYRKSWNQFIQHTCSHAGTPSVSI